LLAVWVKIRFVDTVILGQNIVFFTLQAIWALSVSETVRNVVLLQLTMTFLGKEEVIIAILAGVQIGVRVALSDLGVLIAGPIQQIREFYGTSIAVRV
jgi:hypothetical protein